MINIAYADVAPAAAGAQGGGSMLSSMLPFIIILFFFWLFIIRPQSKRLEAHKQMIAGIKRGDKVVLDSGIIGEVMKVQDHYFVVEIDDEVQIKVLKHKVENLYDAQTYQQAALEEAPPAAKGKDKQTAKNDPKKRGRVRTDKDAGGDDKKKDGN